jgi:hypothetical protein
MESKEHNQPKAHLLELEGQKRHREDLEKQIQQKLDLIQHTYDEIRRLNVEAGKELIERSCADVDCRRNHPIFNLDKIHYLDGDRSNKLDSNRAIICPACGSHIVLGRFTPEDICDLKMKGLSNAKIGEYLGLSRERIRQLSKRYKFDLGKVKSTNIDRLTSEAQDIERRQKAEGTRKRLTDKRTLRKRIIAQKTKLAAKEKGSEL